MASFRSTKLKITIGYILLLAILLFSLVFVHQEMETLSAADDQQNLRTDSLLSLLHEKDQNTLQMLRVLSEATEKSSIFLNEKVCTLRKTAARRLPPIPTPALETAASAVWPPAIWMPRPAWTTR